jgi:sporulation protein YlmC with PRC-barrel domain
MVIDSNTPAGDDGYRGSMRLVIANLQTTLTAYGRDGSKLGRVEQFVMDMFSGRIEYAVLSFGGFLGLGQKYHPIPFSSLRVSTDGAGFIIDVDKVLIDGSPSYRKDDAPAFDEAYGKRIASYYSGQASSA